MAFTQNRLITLAAVCVSITMLVLSSACTTGGANSLLVKTRDASRSQYLPSGFQALMESLDYEWIPVKDPDIGHPVKIATVNGQYRMRFQARDATGIKVDVHIRQDGHSAGLYFTQDGTPSLDAEATVRFQKLRQRLEFEFGTDRVSANRPLLTP